MMLDTETRKLAGLLLAVDYLVKKTDFFSNKEAEKYYHIVDYLKYHPDYTYSHAIEDLNELLTFHIDKFDYINDIIDSIVE